MHERPGQLDQSLVEIPVRPFPVRQPKFLQHVMRLIEKLIVEAIKEAKVVSGQFPPLKGCDALCNVPTFLAHPIRLANSTNKHKSEHT